MYFLKTVLSILQLIILIDGSTEASEVDPLLKITAKIRELQQEVETTFRNFNKTCNLTGTEKSTKGLQELDNSVIDLIKKNLTIPNRHNHQKNESDENVVQHLKIAQRPKGFIEKVKEKFLDFLRFNKTELRSEARVKRCLDSDFRALNLTGAKISIEKDIKINLKTSNIEELNKFLTNFLQCLSTDSKEIPVVGSVANGSETCDRQSNNFSVKVPTETITPLKNNSDFVNLVKYLSKIKHPVQDIGKPIHKSPDLEKIQNVLEQIKNIDFFKLDEYEADNTPDVPPSSVVISKRSSRNIFDDLAAKFKKTISGSKKPRELKPFTSEWKRKSNSGGLFSNINDDRYQVPVIRHNDKGREENAQPSTPVAELSEDRKLLNDMNNFQSRLSQDQQMDISQFLDHINDKPKTFKFDTSSYLQAEMEKLNHPSSEQEADPEDELYGAKSFFDFDNSPVKRSLLSNNNEDFQKIAKLKSKLIAEYRKHHPTVDYSTIFREIEAKKTQISEKTDDFFDHYYNLNDGSSSLDDVMKPFHSDNHVMSPFELNLNFQLDDEFKELDHHQDKPPSDPHTPDIPLYKPEIHSNAEADDYSP